MRGLQQAILKQQRPLFALEPGRGRHAKMAARLGRQDQRNMGLRVGRWLALPLALQNTVLDQRPMPGSTRAHQQPRLGRHTPPPFKFHERPHGRAKVQT